MTELVATRRAYPSSLQIIGQAAGKPLVQAVSLVMEVLAGGARGNLDHKEHLPRRRKFGQVFLKRRSGRAFLVDAKRGGAWKPLVAHHFRLNESERPRLLVSRTGWVAEIESVTRVRRLLGLVVYDVQTKSPNGSSYISLVVGAGSAVL